MALVGCLGRAPIPSGRGDAVPQPEAAEVVTTAGRPHRAGRQHHAGRAHSFLMSGTTGLVHSQNQPQIVFRQCREGCELALPSGLAGVDVGNVTGVRIVPDKPLVAIRN